VEIAFFGCCAYVIVETFALIIAGIRGKDVRGRVIVYLLVLVAAVILGLVLLGQTTSVVTQ
jgi:hypothetical protein